MKKSGLLRGILFLAIGIFLIFWAQSHAPNQGILKSIENELSGAYTLPETWYYGCLGLGILLGIIGVLRTYKSLS